MGVHWSTLTNTVIQQIFGFVKFRPMTTQAHLVSNKISARSGAHKLTSTVHAMTTEFQPQ